MFFLSISLFSLKFEKFSLMNKYAITLSLLKKLVIKVFRKDTIKFILRVYTNFIIIIIRVILICNSLLTFSCWNFSFTCAASEICKVTLLFVATFKANKSSHHPFKSNWRSFFSLKLFFRSSLFRDYAKTSAITKTLFLNGSKQFLTAVF